MTVNDLKRDMTHLQMLMDTVHGRTYTLSDLIEQEHTDPSALQKSLELTAEQFERAVLELRSICEHHTSIPADVSKKASLPVMDVVGSVEMFGYGWLHITLNTLLPHYRFQSPAWLSDTLRRLLDRYESCGKKLPFYRRALMVIDEHSAVEGRHIFDQDNKGWKAVSNAFKGRLFPDDDQYTLSIALLSTKTHQTVCCHITILPLEDAHDFFAAHSSDYASCNFYSGHWF